MSRTPWIGLCVGLLAGCGGQYVITVGDQVAPAGGEAAVVVRLQQHEFSDVKRNIEHAPMRLRIDDGPERGAFTDELGFAGTTVRAPAEPGKFRLTVAMQDAAGDEASRDAPVYVWKKDAAVAAVDLDALPEVGESAAAEARTALSRTAEKYKLLYLTRTDVYDLAPARQKFEAAGYPSGPILVWQRRYRHFARSGSLRLPQVITESKLMTSLSYLRELFPNLKVAVCGSEAASKPFREAGISAVIIGRGGDWASLDRRLARP